MDSHLQRVLVDCNLHILSVGKLCWNVPNTYKRCIESTYTNVKGVQEPPCDNGGTGRTSNSLGSDPYCGKESTGWLAWQEVSSIGWAALVWGQR